MLKLVIPERFGGIIKGSMYSGYTKIENCANKADISGSSTIGGIASATNNNTYIIGCYNTGNVDTKSTHAGGIVGSNGSIPKIINCYNTGNITSTSLTAGITCSGDVKNCYNTGNVTGDSEIGGIIAMNGTTSMCYNAGIIDGEEKANAGGIIGLGETAEDCYNEGSVSGYSFVGGIIGNARSVTNSYNTGKIICSGANPTGGIAGGGTITDSSNIGDVTGPENGAYVRGEIVGMGTIKGNCYYLIKDSNAKTDSCIGKNKSEMDKIMDMQKFVDLLNQKVQEYNNNPENTTKLKSWKLENGKPVFAE